MRLVIDGGGYAAAADAFVTGNQVIAMAAESLSGKVSGYAAMAGDDASSHDFADAYDTTATTALATLAELTESFASLAGLMAASGWNHTTAEAAATLGPGREPGPAPVLDTMSFTPAPVPSAAGGNPPELGNLKGWIVDHVQGFVWPTADTDLLKEAAAAWGQAANTLGYLSEYCRAAASHLAQQISPEIPLALEVIAALEDLVADTHTHVAALAQACDDYADQVDAARQALHAVLDEILAMVVEGALISGLLAGISGGIAAAGGAAAISAKIATKAPDLHKVITTLTTTAGATAAAARTAGHTLTHTQTKLAKYARAKAKLRDERGSIDFDGLPKALRRLKDHDDVGGHVIERHVERPVDALANRARRRGLEYASTFDSVSDAERLISTLLRDSADKVAAWLNTGKNTLRIESDLGVPTGMCVDATGAVRKVTGIRLVLRRDPADPTSWHILTSFPQP